MTKYVFILAALLIGGFLSVQGSINAQLSSFLRHPLQASLTNFLVGTVILIFLNIILRTSLPSIAEMKSVPWYLFLGGAIGAIFVTSVVLLIPKIGVTNMLAASIAGQLIVASIIDHHGLFNVTVHPVSLSRIAGIIMLLLGIFLIQR
ncbi:MAG: bacterial/archaeal transporter family-2 protein [Anaerophaga sp.]|uniref:DMT family transporter n=1 Tax=Anaerophaga thermohalophila TaxID=177400 RepID=UPI000237D5BB|nr:DMT family transporter [Anaerophaga thermohalophila]MDI3521552.1 bacterial/archaeal transporter family-2 protein [Anaerophaga sp.]MDK2842544.1 bacterial/archaeal transporter family-2 protein [Anaerophaga sp.]